MEIPTEQQVIQWYFECLYTDNFIDTLNPYQIEKVYSYAMDYEYNLKPTIQESFENFKNTGNWLPENPMKENVNALTKILKERQTKISNDGPIKIIDTRIERDKETFELLEIESNDIDDLKERIKFWLDKKIEFEKSVDFETLDVSGMTSLRTGLNQKFFLDRLINAEIDRVKELIKLGEPENNASDNPRILKKNRVIMLINELGIFEYLKREYPTLANNETKLAEVISEFTGLNSETIRPTYRAIVGTSNEDRNNPYKNKSNITYLNDKFNEFGISRKK